MNQIMCNDGIASQMAMKSAVICCNKNKPAECSLTYEMKIFLCLFERPFKIKKNGVFLFEISFFVLEILTFSYYAVMTSYGLQQKSGKY